MIRSQPLTVDRPGATLVGERWGSDGPVVVLLHEGVADRRGWRVVAEPLAEHAVVIAYDRRGFGETAPSDAAFSHVDDLLAVVGAVTDGPVVLVGESAGGGLALDTSLTAPSLVAGLVLISPAVSGSPELELDPDTARFDELLERAFADGDLAEANRLETWLWLDGPSAPEGRVGGATRELALEMNATILRNDRPENGGSDDVDAWSRLGEIDVPAIVACGDRDVPVLYRRSEAVAGRLPRGRFESLPGVAHLVELEAPDRVLQLVLDALRLVALGGG